MPRNNEADAIDGNAGVQIHYRYALRRAFFKCRLTRKERVGTRSRARASVPTLLYVVNCNVIDSKVDVLHGKISFF
jgi:hypothetical protein